MAQNIQLQDSMLTEIQSHSEKTRDLVSQGDKNIKEVLKEFNKNRKVILVVFALLFIITYLVLGSK